MSSIFTMLSSLLLLAPTVVVALVTPGGSNGSFRGARSTELGAIKEASFGMGCFWEPSEELLKVDGVVDTVSGYTGNKNFDNDASKKVPSYENVCYGREWVEGVRVTYDTDKISYEKLLDAFFEIQKPQPGSRQYSSMIFPHDEEQLRLAEQWKGTSRERDSDGFKNEWTLIEYPRTKFYAAEGYHQRYWQKQRPRFALMGVLLAIATGFGDQFYDAALESTVKTFANGATVAVGLAITAERFLDSKVVELE
mmetsp:Transcript_10931/g.23155  ORF Transcript_10931/g.23155 Transcript_10931/m.23155 type:complete len:252 (-) Transcript_10931:126-881(-)|eukprot:CAMPEP_0201133428 /NCGR_PEP_ID=MMETSP0850-20130426/48726_1 /ASSEMBLY_ACC=CAM_ASM_000622 /TAXON_ID=183588 /ORGANISM="Pseudo-nitzschia fraudulenta, Strain WWA7" /LENGTH=251 /DNA_ID=CAMNT_0047404049 /DNA_START=85 /DNA_END=840 /DNA_ORIENTATION=-